MTAVKWNPWQYPVNNFYLSGLKSPLCRQPTGAKVVRNLDERQGYGIDGAFLVFTGRKLATFTTELILLDEDAMTYWRSYFQPLIHSVPIRGPVRQSDGGYQPGKSHLIWHPQLVPLEITQCVVVEEPQESIDDYGAVHVPILFQQVKPFPKPAYARPEAPEAEPELSEDQKEIKRLTDKLGSLRQQNKAAGQ